MENLLDPRNDVVFNLFFSKLENKPLLISFLEAVICPKSPITNVTLLNPKLTNSYTDEKGSTLDILVQLHDHTSIDVEMQMRGDTGFRSRMLLYWAKLHQTQLKKSGFYDKIKPTVSIAVLAFNEFDENKDNLHSIFELREINKGTSFNSDLQLHFLELPKLEAWKKQHKNDHGLLESWARFFKISSASQDEINRLTKEPIMTKAIDALSELSQDPTAKQLAEMREKSRFNWELITNASYSEGEAKGREEGIEKGREEGIEKGREEGIEKGREEGIEKGILAMASEGFDALKISKIFQMDLTKVKKILDSLK
jgi:predicted transposase/invertase (TIGR01784 family)